MSGAAAAAGGVPALECSGVEKCYGAVRVLGPVDLSVRRGTIHALVGQNGAGKSTMLGLLAGRIAPTRGTVRVFGQAEALGDPRVSRALGIVAIYQELTTIPALSAVANVFLGQDLARFGTLAQRPMLERYRALCTRLGVRIPPEAPARSLSVADQQVLEILRALQADARIILFDEPTASLAPPERQALFRLMRELRAGGHTMILVSHNLEEVLDIADDVTVFRNGRLVDSRPRPAWDKAQLVAAMVGESMGDIYHWRPGAGAVGEEPVLTLEDVQVPGCVGPVSFAVRPGEIVGIGGLVGSGRTSLLRALAGLEPAGSGRLRIQDAPPCYPRSPRAAQALGIALVPEDRKTQGLVLGMRSQENITLPALGRVARAGMVSEPAMRRAAQQAASRFHFDARRLGEPVGHLSGGNQQKALLARWSYQRPRVLLVDEPTRGIDIGAKSQILDALREIADGGVAIVMVSSELEELSALAARVEVLAEGRHVASLRADGHPVPVSRILNSAFEVAHA